MISEKEQAARDAVITAHKAAAQAYIAAGTKVLGVTATGRAAAALQEAGISAVTSQRACCSEKVWDDVDANTIIVISEPGLVGHQSVATIGRLALKRGAHITFVYRPESSD